MTCRDDRVRGNPAGMGHQRNGDLVLNSALRVFQEISSLWGLPIVNYASPCYRGQMDCLTTGLSTLMTAARIDVK